MLLMYRTCYISCYTSCVQYMGLEQIQILMKRKKRIIKEGHKA
jgi:hypothetical protein